MKEAVKADKLYKQITSEKYLQQLPKVLEQLNLELEDLRNRPIQSFQSKGDPADITSLRFSHFQEKRLQHLQLIFKHLKSSKTPSFSESQEPSVSNSLPQMLEDARIHAEEKREKQKQVILKAWNQHISSQQKLIEKINLKQQKHEQVLRGVKEEQQKRINEQKAKQGSTVRKPQVRSISPRIHHRIRSEAPSYSLAPRTPSFCSKRQEEHSPSKLIELELRLQNAHARNSQLISDRISAQRNRELIHQKVRNNFEVIKEEQEANAARYLTKINDTLTKIAKFKQNNINETKKKLGNQHQKANDKFVDEQHKRKKELRHAEQMILKKYEDASERIRQLKLDRNKKLRYKSEQDKLNFEDTVQHRKRMDRYRISRNSQTLYNRAMRNKEIDERKKNLQQFSQTSRNNEFQFVREFTRHKQSFNTVANKMLSKTALT